MPRFLALAPIPFLLPAALLAQSLGGRVVAGEPAHAVPGVIVQVADSTGAVVSRTLSRDDGAFAVLLPHPGGYTVRTLRIGFRPSSFGPFAVGPAGRAGLMLPLLDVPVELSAVRVAARNECVAIGGSSGTGVLDLWEEARKALLASVVARGDAGFTATITRFERVVSPRTGHTLRQSARQQTGGSERPFISPFPPEEYATRGYRELDGDGATYRAPDADVLLSDGFAETHCLRVAEREPGDEVGVSFEPMPSAATTRPDGQPFVDVAGTLWLERGNARLRRADFHYVGLEPALAQAGVRGRLDFAYLPTGAPVIVAWTVTVPRLERAGSNPRAGLRIADLWVFGGELSEARRGAEVLWRGPGASVRGHVRTAAGAGVPGAVVRVTGTTYVATTDSTGRYAIDHLLPGRYEVRATSPLAERLAVAAGDGAPLDVRAETSAVLDLAVQRDEDVVRTRCGRGAPGDMGVLVGDASAVVPARAPRAFVSVLWLDAVRVQDRELSGRRDGALVQPDSLGRFVVCGVPRERTLDVVVSADSARAERIAHATARIASDSFVATLRLTPRDAARGRIVGRVVGPDGRPIANALVDVIGGASTRADSAGRFALDAETGGVQLLRVRRIGYQLAIRPTSVPDATPVEVAIALAAGAVELAGVTVHGDSSVSNLSDISAFNDRRLRSQGQFITPEQVAARHAGRVEHLLAMVPGIQVDSAGVARVDRGTISIQGDDCREGAQLFIDGAAVGGSFSLRALAPGRVRAIEVYRGPATTPPIFRTSRSACGTVVIWTQ